jgi:hypothetical protein
MFKDVEIGIDSNVLEKWEVISTFVLSNAKKLNNLSIDTARDRLPPNFDQFFRQLLQNSNTTMTALNFFEFDIFPFPEVALPNVSEIHMDVIEDYGSQIAKFDTFMKSVEKNCNYLERFYLYDAHKYPEIVNYINTNYLEHCAVTNYYLTSKVFPVKFSVCADLKSLSEYQYPASIEYLLMDVKIDSPFADDWDNYQTVFASCPKLKGIHLIDEKLNLCLKDDIEHFKSLDNYPIWEERISYLSTKGVKLIGEEERNKKVGEIITESKKWSFIFFTDEN